MKLSKTNLNLLDSCPMNGEHYTFTPTPVDAATGNSALSVSAVGSPKQNLTTD